MLTRRDNHSIYSHEANVALAYQRLDSLRNENKVVIIAGSNGQFSIDSKVIADSLNIPVVNTCAHAGIGVRMQFEMYKELLSKGDIVVFCPEYYSGARRLYGESAIIRILSTHMPKAYMKVSMRQWYFVFKYIGIHYSEAEKHKNSKPFEGAYSLSSVNRYGDISFPREHKEIKVSYNLKGAMDDETTAYYRYIHDYAKEKGIRLVYLPPTLMESAYLSQKAQIGSLASFMKTHDIPFRAAPERYVFNDSLFFDTPYHMTSRGAVIRTKRVVEDIKRVVRN